MITIRLHTPLTIKIDTKNYDYLKELRESFSYYVDGFRFMPAYRSGMWNGKQCLFNHTNKTIPYGLLTDLLKFHKEKFPEEKISLDIEVKKLFTNSNIQYDYNLKYKPYDYQKECIETFFKYSKCIIRSATGSGKSLIISYIVKHLQENNLSKNTLIVVPSIGLVGQFQDDMIDYGLPKDRIGLVYSKAKEFHKPIVVSTWQSLMNNHSELKRYESIVVDEVHGAKSHEIKMILSQSLNAKYRLGMTGTLPSNMLDMMNIKAYLGPIVKEYSAGNLMKEGFLSSCNIKILQIDYEDEDKYGGEYNTVKDMVFTNKYRLNLLTDTLSNINDNVLLLVGKVEKEGVFLEKVFKEKLKNKEIVFLSGKDKMNVREEWRKSFEDKKNIVLIATYGIFQMGINIPSLKYLILASPFKSKIRVLQSIGRTLRKHYSKQQGATIIDLYDNVRYLSAHAEKRIRYYDMEEFVTDIISYKEGLKTESVIKRLFEI